MGIQFQGASISVPNNPRNSLVTGSSTAAAATTTTATTTNTTGVLLKRHPDVILKPEVEGTHFSLQLLAANRMAKVVEWQIFSDKEEEGSKNISSTSSKKKMDTSIIVTEDDIDAIFAAMGSSRHDDDDDDDDVEKKDGEEKNRKDEYVVTEEYEGPDDDFNIQAGGLPYLEALSIIMMQEESEVVAAGSENNNNKSNNKSNDNKNKHTASFLVPLTSFLASSQSFPRFSNLTLVGVNLRGTPLALRALTEVIRLHPRLRRVQMKQCYFTQEQQDDVKGLQAAMATARPSIYDSTTSSSCHQQPQRQNLLVFHEPGEQPPEPSFMKQQPPPPPPNNNNNPQPLVFDAEITTPLMFHTVPVDTEQPGSSSTTKQQQWWGERLLKSCLCWR